MTDTASKEHGASPSTAQAEELVAKKDNEKLDSSNPEAQEDDPHAAGATKSKTGAFLTQRAGSELMVRDLPQSSFLV